MFYFFSKTITYLLTPAGWLLTALLWAFFNKTYRHHRLRTGIALGIFWLFGNSVLINELAWWWEYPVQADIPKAADSTSRVAVLLTGGMINGMKEIPVSTQAQNQTTRFLLGREADRAGQAFYLYKTGAVQKILISGGSGNLPFQPKDVSDEGQMTAQFLMMAGVRPGDLVLENKSRNTHENALFAALMLRQRFRTNQCVLVTSAWHMRRAMACFQKEGIVVTPFPGNFLSHRRPLAPGEWILPKEEALFDAYYLVREMVGYLTYQAMGFV